MNANVLWIKESELPNALYVDIFREARFSSIYRQATIEMPTQTRKDNGLSLKYRQEGNAEFQRNRVKKAIELFNKSLCFAETESEHQGLAYANRALCFLTLKMYQECLLDIESARKANYPERLMPKLEKRESECKKSLKTSMGKGNIQNQQPGLSFPADEMIPSMANVIKIVRNDKFGRHIVAGCDIEVDKTVVIEEPMFKLLNAGEYKKCLVCLKEDQNLIPCKNCTSAMFCSATCFNNEFHKYECGMRNIHYFEGANGVKVRNGVRFVMQSVLNILSSFPSTDEMIQFVVECIEQFRNDPLEIAVSDGSIKSNFKTFLKLHYVKSCDEVFIFYVIHACIAYETLMDCREFQEKFSTASKQRFLMHLMTHLISIFKSNNVLLREWEGGDIATTISTDGFVVFGAALFNIGCYFNHSCLPNVINIENEKYSVTKTIRPIKAGDPICIRYCVSALRPTKERREVLLKACQFFCNCELCLVNGPAINKTPVMESAIRALASHTSTLMLNKQVAPDVLEQIKKKCYEFLAQFQDTPISEGQIMAYENLKMIYVNEMQNIA